MSVYSIDDLYHACTFKCGASVGTTHNSLLKGAMKLKFAPFYSS